jgi:uncharacterized membrane protein YadS
MEQTEKEQTNHHRGALIAIGLGFLLNLFSSTTNEMLQFTEFWASVISGVGIVLMGLGVFLFFRNDSDADHRRMGWVFLLLSILVVAITFF